MIDKAWIRRRGVAIALLVPGYCVGYLAAFLSAPLFEHFYNISPYLPGAFASTAFNTLMWDRFVALVYRFGGKASPQP